MSSHSPLDGRKCSSDKRIAFVHQRELGVVVAARPAGHIKERYADLERYLRHRVVPYTATNDEKSVRVSLKARSVSSVFKGAATRIAMYADRWRPLICSRTAFWPRPALASFLQTDNGQDNVEYMTGRGCRRVDAVIIMHGWKGYTDVTSGRRMREDNAWWWR